MSRLTVTIPYSVRISRELLDEMRRLYDRMEPPKPTFSAVLSHIVKLGWDSYKAEKNSTSCRILKTMFFVLENCLVCPLTRSSIPRLSGFPAWSGVTRKGPIGAKDAKFLPRLQKPLFISAN